MSTTTTLLRLFTLSLLALPCLSEWRGGDISLLPDVEQAQIWAEEKDGQPHKFYDRYGNPDKVENILADNGWNIVRVHLFHTPVGKCCNEAQAIALARRFQNAGMDIILDLHLSDDWGNAGM